MKDLGYYNENYPGNVTRELTSSRIDYIKRTGYKVPSNKDYVRAKAIDFSDYVLARYYSRYVHLMILAWVEGLPVSKDCFKQFEEIYREFLNWKRERSTGLLAS